MGYRHPISRRKKQTKQSLKFGKNPTKIVNFVLLQSAAWVETNHPKEFKILGSTVQIFLISYPHQMPQTQHNREFLKQKNKTLTLMMGFKIKILQKNAEPRMAQHHEAGLNLKILAHLTLPAIFLKLREKPFSQKEIGLSHCYCCA